MVRYMKTWSKADLLSSLLVVFGIICLIFSTSSLLTISCFLFSSVILLHGVYTSRYEIVKYRDLLCHYQSVLSSSKDGWIAWNAENEYIGSSKKFRNFFDIKHSASIFMTDIISAIEKKDSEELMFMLNKLKKTGSSFAFTVKTINSNSKIEISGSKIVINGIETFSLWCTDVTRASSLMLSMEEKLFKSEEVVETLNEILDELPIQVWKRDKNLKIIYCNKAYADSLDISVEKVLLNNVPLVPGNLFGQGHSLAENARKCGRNQNISQFVIIKGLRKKLSIHENQAADGNLIGFAADISAEENLTANLDKIITANYDVLENLSTAIAIFGENTRLVFFNSAYQKLMKLESVWLHSKPTYGEILDECRNNRQLPEHADFQSFKKSQLALFMSITASTQELMHLPSGKTLRVVVAPYPLGGLLFMYEDVTDSLVLQRKNNTLLAVQKETINHLHEGVIVYGSDNRLKIVNDSILKIWNIKDKTPIDMKGIHLSEMLEYVKDMIDYGSDWSEFRENTISNLTDRITKTGKMVRKDNSVLLFSYIPLPDGAHMLSYIDITDTYVVEKAIMEKNHALKEAHKLRYEFISGISVELKEPINSLIGFTELLSRQYYGALNEKQQEYCKYILSSSNQLHQLINNLLEMVLIDMDSSNLELNVFNIKDAIDEVLSTLEKRAEEKNIEIVSFFEDSEIQFNGDRKRIKQFLFNVLINAIQTTPINGKVEIRVTNDSEYIKVIIKIEGIEPKKGENGDVHKRSAKRYSRKMIESNAASMCLVRSLIETNGGTLKIDSDNNGNTYVICSLPMNCKDSEEQSLYDIADDSEIAFEGNLENNVFSKNSAGIFSISNPEAKKDKQPKLLLTQNGTYSSAEINEKSKNESVNNMKRVINA